MNTTPRAEVAQITALIERAKEQRDRDAAEHCPAEIIALQDEVIAGLEALEAENLGLRLECQGLKAEVAEVKSFWKEAQLRNRNLLEERNDLAFLADQYKAERDALAAELAGLKSQEPVGFAAPHEIENLREGYPATVVMLPSNKRTDPLYAAPKALAPRFTECRIELVGAIHTLASHYENRLGRLDPEDRKLAEGDIAHAMATAAKWNWNGNGIGGTP
ncbi:hypothetical protein MCEMIEM13_01488 [Comamonadaceae bacterium]